MNFQLQHNESLPEGIKRIFYEEIDFSLISLQSEENPHEGVHNARKSFKKIRAVIRFVRDEIGSEQYVLENTWYRDAGRKLSALRDATAMIETLDKIRLYYPDSISDQTYKSLEKILLKNQEEISDLLLVQKNIRETVSFLIKEGRERVEKLNLSKNSFRAIKKSVCRVYTQGYDGLALALDDPSDYNLHEWRKSVKHIWYHILLLKNIWPGMMDAYAEELHQLSEMLGTDHDLALLNDALENGSLSVNKQTVENQILNIIARYRHDLQMRIYTLASKIYRQRPNDFVSYLETYWNTWRRSFPLNLY
ncbi:MAG: CHAD domain-containing protein [Bacteroidia bacterium]|nr:CHAD domain-containing protein [Bacteroidia bacterium]